MTSRASRAWQLLIDKLSEMDVEAVQGQDHVFRFSRAGHQPVDMRIKSQHDKYEDGVEEKEVELLDETGEVIARESWSICHSIFAEKREEHLLEDLFELIKKEGRSSGRKLEAIHAIERLVASL